MENEKKSIWTKLFAPKKSSCCSMRIEEVAEDDAGKGKLKDSAPTRQPLQGSSCCAGTALESEGKEQAGKKQTGHRV